MDKSNCKELDTHSMPEIYDTTYEPQIPIVENFLYGGTYLFVGAPKVGKSFFMAQLSYHVAMGLPLWGNKVHQSTVLSFYIWHWRIPTPDCRSGSIACSE